MIYIELPKKVAYIIDKLMQNGYEAFVVGGCVRDTMLGGVPKDWDITTSAKPYEVKQLFQRTVDTGIEHGTVTVMLEKEGFEVTTYRIDGEYEDSRHPLHVEFTQDLREDLRRRDFTINAMAYSPKTGLVDLFGGLEDLSKKRIRCVGKAVERFEEDALRMLRAVRFAGQLGFTIEEGTLFAIRTKADTLQHISAERIREELTKLICSKDPGQMRIASETGILKVVLPEFDHMLKQKQNNPHHIMDVGNHALLAVENFNVKYHKFSFAVQDNLYGVFVWTLLLHDAGKPQAHTVDENGIDHFFGHAKISADIAKDVLKRLKFDNYTIELVNRLVYWHDFRFTLKKSSIRKAAAKIGPDIMEYLFAVQRMDALAQNPSTVEEKLKILDKAEEIYQAIVIKQECLTLKELKINGNDLIVELGMERGPLIGRILNELLEYVLENPQDNEHDILLEVAKNSMCV